MELRQLRYFTKIAELKSFSAAARVLNMSQSTLSQQIQQLEHELGVTLLARTSRHVDLTEIGSQILPVVMSTLADADTCVDVVKNAQALKTGTLRIGCSYSFIRLLDEASQNFLKQYPDMKLMVRVESMDKLLNELSHRELDIVITYRPTRRTDNIESTKLFSSELSVVMSDTNPLAAKKSINLKEDLKHYHVVMPDVGMQSRYLIDHLAGRIGYKPKVSITTDNITNLLDLVAASHMVSFLAKSTIMDEDGVVAIPIEGEKVEMEACYHTRKDNYVKYSVKEFARVVSESNVVNVAQQKKD